MIYDEYANYTRVHKERYGPCTLVLMEVGSFWELYDCDEHLGADMARIGQLLNIQVSRKNKNIPEVSRTNPQMAGFPSHALNRFLPLLIDAGYTVVLVGQITSPPNPKRGVIQVISKGTYVDPDALTSNAPVLVSIYVAQSNHYAIASMDVSTGRCVLYEATSTRSNSISASVAAAQESLYRFIHAQRPVEALIFGGSPAERGPLVSLIKSTGALLCHDCGDVGTEFENISYQNQLLKKVFPHVGLLSPLEAVDLERNPFLATAYAALLQFAYEHDETIVQRIAKPEQEADDSQLVLCYNAAEQLDLVGLDRLLNACQTAMGRRAFRHQLFHPIVDVSVLQNRYDAIHSMMENDQYVMVRSELARVYDLERLFRRVNMHSIMPYQVYQIRQSLDSVWNAFSAVKNQSNEAAQLARMIIAFIDKRLVFTPGNSTLRSLDEVIASGVSLFKPGVDTFLDKLQASCEEYTQVFQRMLACIQERVPGACVKLESNERDGYHFLLTQKRLRDLRDQLKNVTEPTSGLCFGDLLNEVVVVGTTVKLAHTAWLSTMNSKLTQTRSALRDCMQEAYDQCIVEFADAFDNTTISAFIQAVCDLDIAACMAKQSVEYGYVRPTLISEGNGSVKVQAIRHPIIERVQDHIPYVTNDVELRKDAGMLLFGLNAAGKSSLMKALGLNVIMAQAGFFVAADSMWLRPYSRLFTRIAHHDDIYRGQSTFMVEMSELRTILSHANENSIVLGDELCSGTEAVSASAIVAAGIVTLCRRGVSFVFATHLHDLTEIESVKEQLNSTRLRLFHLHVEYDAHSDKLIYDRKLKPGEGHRLYGLEVCKSLGMDSEFMRLADMIRRNQTGVPENLLQAKRSRYNSKLFVDACCAVCGQGNAKSTIEVHHITEQHMFEKKQGKQKNRLSNMVCLCRHCHDNIHSGHITIKGYVQTSKGVELTGGA